MLWWNKYDNLMKFMSWGFTLKVWMGSSGYSEMLLQLFRCSNFNIMCFFLAHLSRRLEWAIVITHRPPSFRPSSSVRKLFIFSSSSPEPLDGFGWNLVGLKYSWSLTSVVVFRPDPLRDGSRDGSRAGPNWSLGVPSSRNFFRPEGYSDKPNG